MNDLDEKNELIFVDPEALRKVIAQVIAEEVTTTLLREIPKAVRRARGKVD